MAEQKRIPIHGSMTRPADPEQGLEELKKNKLPWEGGSHLMVTFSTDEFTSVCPTTGQPDFSKIEVTYTPNKSYLESKSIKFYLWSFRDYGAHCETLANKIARDIEEAIEPNYLEVIVTQKPRGGIEIKSRATT